MNTSPTVLGSMPLDANDMKVQVPTGFQTNDATPSPITSPFVMTGGIDILIRPTNAVELIVFPAANNITVSEVADMSQFCTVLAGTNEVFEIARMEAIYIQGTDGDTLSFRFNLI